LSGSLAAVWRQSSAEAAVEDVAKTVTAHSEKKVSLGLLSFTFLPLMIFLQRRVAMIFLPA